MSAPDAVLARTLEKWHHCVATRDMSTLREILHPDAVFRSPVAHTPYPGADVVTLILGTVVQVFEDFTYHRTLVSEDSRSVVLEFSARVSERQLKGIDLSKLDDSDIHASFAQVLGGLEANEASSDDNCCTCSRNQ